MTHTAPEGQDNLNPKLLNLLALGSFLVAGAGIEWQREGRDLPNIEEWFAPVATPVADAEEAVPGLIHPLPPEAKEALVPEVPPIDTRGFEAQEQGPTIFFNDAKPDALADWLVQEGVIKSEEVSTTTLITIKPETMEALESPANRLVDKPGSFNKVIGKAPPEVVKVLNLGKQLVDEKGLSVVFIDAPEGRQVFKMGRDGEYGFWNSTPPTKH